MSEDLVVAHCALDFGRSENRQPVCLSQGEPSGPSGKPAESESALWGEGNPGAAP